MGGVNIQKTGLGAGLFCYLLDALFLFVGCTLSLRRFMGKTAQNLLLTKNCAKNTPKLRKEKP